MGRARAAGVAVAAVVMAPLARADETRAAWWVEVRPWTCAEWTAPLAREIQLACDAVGACTVAAEEAHADRRAVLSCAGETEPWTIDAQSATGLRLWSVTLNGAPAAKLRQASMWIARAEAEGPTQEPRPAPIAPQAAPTRAADADRPAADAPPQVEGSVVGLTLDARAGYFLADADHSRGGAFTLAVRGALVARHKSTYVGVAIAGEGTPAADSGDSDSAILPHTGSPGRVLLARGGVVFGWGAPVAPEWIGFAVEIGGGGGVVPMSEAVQDSGATCFDGCTGWDGYVLQRYQKPVGFGYADARVTMSPWGVGPYFAVDVGVNRNGIPSALGSVFFGGSVGYAWGAL
jgi:hypothetical protein